MTTSAQLDQNGTLASLCASAIEVAVGWNVPAQGGIKLAQYSEQVTLALTGLADDTEMTPEERTQTTTTVRRLLAQGVEGYAQLHDEMVEAVADAVRDDIRELAFAPYGRSGETLVRAAREASAAWLKRVLA